MEIISKGVSKEYIVKKGLFKKEIIEPLKDFNYCIKQGELIGIIGEDNSGKSTIVNLLSGRERPTRGEVLIDGEVDRENLKANSEIISDLCGFKLSENDSVYNNLVYLGNKFRIDSLDVEKRIVDLKDVFELDRVINKKINEISSLERAKLNVVIAMLKMPLILYFDSSISGMGVVEKNVVLKLLKRLNKEFKTTVVICSDSIMDVEKICKRITLIKDGKIIRDDSKEKIKQDPINKKEIRVVFNKTYTMPKGGFEVIYKDDYLLRLSVSAKEFDFATFITQFDMNSIIDISIKDYISL